EIGAVVADGPVLGRGVVERVAVGLGLLEPSQVGPDRAEVGARAVPSQRRALEVAGVPGEQLRILRSQFGGLNWRASCVLRSATRILLLRMYVLRSLKNCTRPPAQNQPTKPSNSRMFMSADCCHEWRQLRRPIRRDCRWTMSFRRRQRRRQLELLPRR